ncbi:MAG: cytochrome c [Bryocella sp.]
MRLTQKISVLGAAAAMLLLAGCRQDMHDEPKFFPQRGTTFYPDGRSVRPQVENTVARDQLHQDGYFYTGLKDGKEADGLPVELKLDTALLERGEERYNIYCAPCHSRVGNGVGMIVQRGYRPAGDFNTDRLRQSPLGHYFSVMTNGYGAMPDYAAQVTPADRWAIAAYIRALELSQDAKATDAPGEQLKSLHQIAKEQGMPPGFADPWELPATAIYGTPDNQDHGIPAIAVPISRKRALTMGQPTTGNPQTAAPTNSKTEKAPAAPKPAATK